MNDKYKKLKMPLNHFPELCQTDNIIRDLLNKFNDFIISSNPGNKPMDEIINLFLLERASLGFDSQPDETIRDLLLTFYKFIGNNFGKIDKYIEEFLIDRKKFYLNKNNITNSPDVYFPERNHKPLNVINGKDAKKKISDIEIFGNPDLFQLISKASSKSGKWMKSTKAMEIKSVGCVIQVTTQNHDNVAESVTFVPGCRIGTDKNDNKFIELRVD